MIFWKRKETPPAEDQPSKEQRMQELREKIASLTAVRNEILTYAGTPDWGGITDRNHLADIERRIREADAEMRSLEGPERETSSESEEKEEDKEKVA